MKAEKEMALWMEEIPNPKSEIPNSNELTE
jgi:hypothetical protein